MTDDLFTVRRSDGPLIFSVPHAGTYVPSHIQARLTLGAQSLPDTDWHVDKIYDFGPALGATTIVANYSRYVVDLNRPPSGESLYPGQATTGLCPAQQFDGTPIYGDGAEVTRSEAARRTAQYWQPYHTALAEEIARVKRMHGYAMLYDCHSIASRVPRLFEGTLPDLNLGTVNGTSCAPGLQDAIVNLMASSGLSHISNGRFVGGHITRAYGKPHDGVHAVQMEKGQDCHLREDSVELDPVKSDRLRSVLKDIANAMLAWGERHGRSA